MKIFIIFILLSIFGLSGFADSIDVEIARNAAKYFYFINSNIDISKINMNLVFIAKEKSQSKNAVDEQLYYVFNINQNDGYVIIAADNDVLPILSYSLKGHYTNENLPPAYIEWMDKCKAEIQYVKKNHIKADVNIQKQWEDLINEKKTSHKGVKSVNPLLTTIWGQSPYYNELCPFDNSLNQRTVTGCVATAMAQIMKFWNYPTQGTSSYSYVHPIYGTLSADFGNTTYNWSGMPDNVNSSNISVATLMKHCGVSVDMNYGVNVSYAYPTHVVYAYQTYFNYSSSINTSYRVNFTDNEWILILKSELDAGRPVHYWGCDSINGSGHSFVCDGYGANDFFYFNWGWSGSHDNDLFNINALNPGSKNYNSNQFVFIGIQPSTSVSLPIVTTMAASDILSYKVECGGSVVSDGGSSVTDRGVCWSISPNPTIVNDHTTDGTGLGSFTSNIIELTGNTTYYVRAYATNSSGTSYGNQVIFTTLTNTCPSSVTDIDGNSYNVVSIGSQCWTKENLKTTRYSNGVAIPIVTDDTSWESLSTDAYCWYDNNYNTYGSIYGALYNWYTVETDNLCPSGWHVPSDAEWTQLINYLGGDSVAGGKMKEIGTTHWNSPNTGANNSSSLTGLPGGYRVGNYGTNNPFDNIGYMGGWWSTTEINSTNAFLRLLSFNDTNVLRLYYYNDKVTGLSVRCLKDTPPTNNDCTGALMIEQSTTCTPITGTTAYATQSLVAISCSGITGTADDDVWYKFIAYSTNPTITVTGDANFDAVVELLSGNCNGTNVNCADATGYGGTETINTSGLTIGATYYIRVYSYSSSLNGTFTICVYGTYPASSNDNWTVANILTQNTTCSPVYGSTINSTQSITANECGGTTDDDVWFSFVAQSETPIIKVVGSNLFDPVLELLDNNKTNITCSNATENGGTEIINAIGLEIGATYYIRVYSFGTGTSVTFSLCVYGSSVGVIENEVENSIIIYPNPANETVTVTFNTTDRVNTIEIVNTIGHTVFVKQIKSIEKSEQIDISDLPQGIYFIKVQTDKRNIIKKIIKE
jgi:uncharacterized protein (TIGR02145 family)